MRKHSVWSVLLYILIIAAVVISFSACDFDLDDDDNNDDETNKDGETNDSPDLTGLVLIKDNVAQFQVVTSSTAGSSAIHAANKFITKLRALGVEVADAVTDKDAKNVKECEIILGLDVKNRPDECVIGKDLIGESGYAIKVVGKRLIIAGGTTNITRDKFNNFLENTLNLKEDTTSFANVACDDKLNVVSTTQYNVESFTIAGIDISNYVISYDQSDYSVYPYAVESVRNAVQDACGKRLTLVNSAKTPVTGEQIIVRSVDKAGEDGFRVFVSDNNLIIECAYPVLFAGSIDKFLSNEISSKYGSLNIASGYTYSQHISTIKYSDYDVVGDGKTNDFFAIRAVHEIANVTKQTVVADAGKQYYIGANWEEEGGKGLYIDIKSNVDWTGATFIIDDNVNGAYDEEYRNQNLFRILSDYGTVVIKNEEDLNSLSTNRKIAEGATSIPWITSRFTEEKYYVMFRDENDMDFIRYGLNADSGRVRTDVVLVNGNGEIDSSTPVVYPVNNVTELRLLPVTDTPITIKGCKFITNAKQPTAQDKKNGKAPTAYIYRNIGVYRPNTTLCNFVHEIKNAPSASKKIGYSAYGFITIKDTADVTLKDTKLIGRISYGTSVSSYDLTINNTINAKCLNVTQSNSLTDKTFWGITATNGCKNLVFESCKLSRIDAHCAVWKITIKKCEVGQSITLIGGGDCLITDTKRTSGSAFVSLRHDYGATYNGKITIKNCEFKASESNPVVIQADYRDSSTYRKHDFGYKLYMPTEVHLRNFTCNKTTYYVFNNVVDKAFTEGNKYVKTTKVTYNMSTKPALCSNTGCTQIRGISISKSNS